MGNIEIKRLYPTNPEDDPSYIVVDSDQQVGYLVAFPEPGGWVLFDCEVIDGYQRKGLDSDLI